jgi:MATE family multidrug resistance protein
MGQAPHIVVLAKPFLQIVGVSIIPALIFQTFKQFMEGLSQTKEPMFVALIGELLNIFLNIVLVFGFLGFPQLGLIGSGVATLIARIIMVIMMTWIFLNRENFKIYAQGFQQQIIDSKLFNTLLKIGLPIGLQVIFESSCFAFSAIMAGWVGDNGKTLAAHQIALNIAATTYLIAAGISTAASIRTAGQKALKNVEEMQMAGKSAMVIVTVFMFLCAMTMVLGRNLLPSLYVNDEIVIGIASKLLLVAAVFQLSDGIQVVSIGALRGLHDVKIPTLITLIAYWGVGTPLAAFLMFYMGWGGVGIWAALAFALSVAAILLSYRFLKLCREVVIQ